MGLDMYLYRGEKEAPLEEVGYWRKANAIHGWIVDNVQNGDDNCDLYVFPLDKMVELYFLCDQVIKSPSKAQLLLPHRKGCFFGSYEYDEWYMQDIKYTKKLLKKCLRTPRESYVYESSW